MTPLSLTAAKGHLECVTALIEAGADKEAMDKVRLTLPATGATSALRPRTVEERAGDRAAGRGGHGYGALQTGSGRMQSPLVDADSRYALCSGLGLFLVNVRAARVREHCDDVRPSPPARALSSYTARLHRSGRAKERDCATRRHQRQQTLQRKMSGAQPHPP